jgi:hypothetical protein
VVHEFFTSENAHVAVGNLMTRSCSRISWSTTERNWASEQSIVAVLPAQRAHFRGKTPDNEDMVNVRIRGIDAFTKDRRSRRLRHYRLLALHKHK